MKTGSLLLLLCGGLWAQSPSWLKGYHLAGPPAPVTAVAPRNAALENMQDVQLQTMWAIREARDASNYYAVTEAIREARANAALIAQLQAAQPGAKAAQPASSIPLKVPESRPELRWVASSAAGNR
ncbi:MAG: hypothetical protein M1436_07785 [Acidobacteria bacterium]|nr:hypothetical protein [Acidobacteriota bacterium]